MRLLKRLLFGIRAYRKFVKAARSLRNEQLGCDSVALQNQKMNDKLQDVYCLLLEDATRLTMKDEKGDDIFYNILDAFHDFVQSQYVKD